MATLAVSLALSVYMGPGPWFSLLFLLPSNDHAHVAATGIRGQPQGGLPSLSGAQTLGLLLVRPSLDSLGLGQRARLVFILDRGWKCSDEHVGGAVVLMGKTQRNEPLMWKKGALRSREGTVTLQANDSAQCSSGSFWMTRP